MLLWLTHTEEALKPLPNNDSEDVTVDTTECAQQGIVKCSHALCVNGSYKSRQCNPLLYSVHKPDNIHTHWRVPCYTHALAGTVLYTRIGGYRVIHTHWRVPCYTHEVLRRLPQHFVS
jgi:hypothetical protein